MSSKLILVLFGLTYPGVHLYDLGSKNSNNYGSYTVDFSNYEICKGPKAKDVAAYNITVDLNGTDYISRFQLTFLEQTRLSEVKIIVSTIKNHQKNLLWSYRLGKPCQHFVVASLIQNRLNATNCVIKKGSYEVEINLTEEATKFFGTSFFYGEYLLKSSVLAPNGNILCLVLKPVFKKKI